MTEKVIHDKYQVWLEDDILHFVVLTEVLDLKYAMEVNEIRKRFCNGRKYADFIDMRSIKYVTKEAREYMADPEISSLVKAGAVLFKSKVQVILGNYYLKFNNPTVPTRFFYTKEVALAWLNKYK